MPRRLLLQEILPLKLIASLRTLVRGFIEPGVSKPLKLEASFAIRFRGVIIPSDEDALYCNMQ